MKNWSLLLILATGMLFSCGKKAPEPLPVLGNMEIVNGDTLYHTVPDFSFVDQESQMVTNATFADKAYVVDFFFISCPTICPMVTKQMMRIHDRFKMDDRLMVLAHTIDTKHDSVSRLKQYAVNLGVDTRKWRFVTGIKDEIYGIANDYFSIAIEDPNAPGGFDHSGRLILVDKNRRVRSFSDGTDPASVDRFMEDINTLLKEYPSR